MIISSICSTLTNTRNHCWWWDISPPLTWFAPAVIMTSCWSVDVGKRVVRVSGEKMDEVLRGGGDPHGTDPRVKSNYTLRDGCVEAYPSHLPTCWRPFLDATFFLRASRRAGSPSAGPYPDILTEPSDRILEASWSYRNDFKWDTWRFYARGYPSEDLGAYLVLHPCIPPFFSALPRELLEGGPNVLFPGPGKPHPGAWPAASWSWQWWEHQ